MPEQKSNSNPKLIDPTDFVDIARKFNDELLPRYLAAEKKAELLKSKGFGKGKLAKELTSEYNEIDKLSLDACEAVAHRGSEARGDGMLYAGVLGKLLGDMALITLANSQKIQGPHLDPIFAMPELFVQQAVKAKSTFKATYLEFLNLSKKYHITFHEVHQEMTAGRSTMQEKYAQLALENTVRLLGIDSPSGYTENAAKYVQAQFAQMGYDAKITRKGGVLIDLGGKDTQDALLLEAHTDTLGGMVAQIKGNGRLRITNVGGMNANNAEAENVRVITKFSGAIDGTVQLCDASVHVNGNYSTTPRTFDTVEVVLDEDVRSAEDVRKLGIDVGDFVCFDPRSRITESGYIKSRFLDDKLSVGILQAFAQYLKDENLTPKRRVYVHVTVYEEVGHGGAASVPDGVTEAISVDMGCVGEGVQCTERQVSICAKDSGGPYSYDVVRKLIAAAKREGADYAVDVYPHYGSDVEATLRAGYDIRHGLIGAGVYASHGYERSHRDGALNTLKVIEGYLFE